MDIDIVLSTGLPVDETRLQYVTSAVDEMQNIPTTSKNPGSQPQESDKRTCESVSEAQHSNYRSQEASTVNGNHINGGNFNKAVEVSG